MQKDRPRDESHDAREVSEAEPLKTPRKADGGRNAVKKPTLRPGERGARKDRKERDQD